MIPATDVDAACEAGLAVLGRLEQSDKWLQYELPKIRASSNKEDSLPVKRKAGEGSHSIVKNTISDLKEVKIELYTIDDVPKALHEWMFQLLKCNMKEIYLQARDTGWSDQSKRSELSEAGARFLVARVKAQSAGNDGGTRKKRSVGDGAQESDPSPGSEIIEQEGTISDVPIGFLYFQFTMEDCSDPDLAAELIGSNLLEDGFQVPVMYCYELQLDKDYRRGGLGKHMLKIMEELGKAWKMRKAMLTVFKHNTDAIGFYNSMRYEIDAISPSNCLPARRAQRVSYEILSKRL
ncbi:hypothetical protein BJ742DRAFT_368733 [Cladochytrium replicatum]|nr:hypothetical protein BJ742DRAFT_368733 [Cladochytrium replicatum]